MQAGSVGELKCRIVASDTRTHARSEFIYKISGRGPPLLTWHIFKIIVDSLSPIVTTCVLNQSKSHWLLFDALQFAITMCLKFGKKL